MKQILLIFFAFVSIQYQSQINKDYFITYGQVWGFLKYFHPTPGNIDWDQQLISDYESITKCDDKREFNTILTKLIEACGEYSPLKREVSDSLLFEESYEWLANDLINSNNQKYLIELLKNKPEFTNKYIAQGGAGNPKILNEKTYEGYHYNPAIQYLSITRYWNIINYFCPNRDIIPKNWTQAYKDHLLDFIQSETYEDYYFAVRKMTSEIRDGHGFVRTKNNPLTSYRFVPFYCQSVPEGYFITMVWQDSMNSYNLQKMDKIIQIDGIAVEEKIKEIGEYVATSNDYYLSKSTYYLRLYNKTSIDITVERNGQLVETSIPTVDQETLLDRYNAKKISTTKPKSYELKTDSVSNQTYCYVNLGLLTRKEINGKFKRTLSKTDHLILDVRNYPNWTVIKLSALLLEGKTTFAKFKKMDFDYPGSYEWTASQVIGNDKNGYSGNLYVLVDYNTMSQAEYTVMAFQQHPKCKVIGGQTAGADGNVSGIPLPYGIESVFSGLGVFYPDGTATQQIGVKRDFMVVQQLNSITQNQDQIMEKTLELIRN